MSYSLPSLSLRKQSFAIPQRAQVVRSCSPTLIALACGEPPCVRATLAHRFAVEPAQACAGSTRSEEHTSELQSHSDIVCRLLLEKKKGRLTARTRRTACHCTTGPARRRVARA